MLKVNLSHMFLLILSFIKSLLTAWSCSAPVYNTHLCFWAGVTACLGPELLLTLGSEEGADWGGGKDAHPAHPFPSWIDAELWAHFLAQLSVIKIRCSLLFTVGYLLCWIFKNLLECNWTQIQQYLSLKSKDALERCLLCFRIINWHFYDE